MVDAPVLLSVTSHSLANVDIEVDLSSLFYQDLAPITKTLARDPSLSNDSLSARTETITPLSVVHHRGRPMLIDGRIALGSQYYHGLSSS